MRSSIATDFATAEPGVRGYLERLMGWQRQADAVAVAAVPADGAIAGALADPRAVNFLLLRSHARAALLRMGFVPLGFRFGDSAHRGP